MALSCKQLICGVLVVLFSLAGVYSWPSIRFGLVANIKSSVWLQWAEHDDSDKFISDNIPALHLDADGDGVPEQKDALSNQKIRSMFRQFELEVVEDRFYETLFGIVFGNILTWIASYLLQMLVRMLGNRRAALVNLIQTQDRTQDDMKEHFRKTCMDNDHVYIKRIDAHFGAGTARKAIPGETICTVIDGKETVEPITADREPHMVVRDNTIWNELRLLPQTRFDQLYYCPEEIEGNDAEARMLQDEHFMKYKSDRKVYAREVTKADEEFVESGYFMTKWGKRQPLCKGQGQFLAMGFNDPGADVYIIPNGGMVAFERLPVLTQVHMKQYFSDKFENTQSLWKKSDPRILARPAVKGETIVENYSLTLRTPKRTTIDDNDSHMVVLNIPSGRASGVYLMEKSMFGDTYDVTRSEDPAEEVLKRAKFKRYPVKEESKWWMYDVTSDDMQNFVLNHGGMREVWFRTNFDEVVQLKAGYCLAAKHPFKDDIYVLNDLDRQSYENVWCRRTRTSADIVADTPALSRIGSAPVGADAAPELLRRCD